LQDELNTDYNYSTDTGVGLKFVSEQGTKRLVRAALNHALAEKRKSVTIVHKGNIMKFTEGAFKSWGYQVAEEEFGDRVYTWNQWEKTKQSQGQQAANAEQTEAEGAGKLIVKDIIADNFLQQILLAPEDYD